MDNISIQFDHVGKLYRLGLVGTGTLRQDLYRWWQTKILNKEDPFLKVGEVNDRTRKGNSDYIWALKNISFDVKQGEVVGIIGKNGAGKSTLLKLLSRVTSPTTGTIRANGRIASLLEVGTGFHGEMTGRENIYMNGSIMGMTRAEINRKLDDIVEFAGVERYIDTPVKRYSSGMTVRLGFAVSAFLEPEILVVDEVLAVGDAEFQKKAIGKMQDVSRGDGRTVLFVSHNLGAIKNLCERGVVLNNGEMVFDGNVDEAVDYYLQDSGNGEDGRIVDAISYRKDYISITSIAINGSESNRQSINKRQDYLDISIKGETANPIKCDVKLIIKRLDGTPLAAYIEGRYTDKLIALQQGPFEIDRRIRLPRYLANGDFIIDLYLNQPSTQDFFRAQGCLNLHIEGFYDPFSRPLILGKDGFIGLESE
ncbi:MAG: ABC transporter ATP-binding protein [Bacteroidales bacterium]|nr:ABC transporter ATP-binding protein [Bacteroidales bacterium]